MLCSTSNIDPWCTCSLDLLILIFTLSAKNNLQREFNNYKENQYIFVGSKKAKETEKIVESILEGMNMFCLWIMTSCKRHLCDGQKIDKQKYFSLETCMYNLKQLILLESVSSKWCCRRGHPSSRPIHHTGPDTVLGRSASCDMPKCLRIFVRQSKPWGIIYVCLKKGNWKLFIFDAIDFNKDVDR